MREQDKMEKGRMDRGITYKREVNSFSLSLETFFSILLIFVGTYCWKYGFWTRCNSKALQGFLLRIKKSQKEIFLTPDIIHIYYIIYAQTDPSENLSYKTYSCNEFMETKA